MSGERERLALAPIGDDPEVGRWLAALEDGRRDTLRELEGVTPDMVDWSPDAPLNSIGSLLYHIGLIEWSWVSDEMLGDPEAMELQPLLPWPNGRARARRRAAPVAHRRSIARRAPRSPGRDSRMGPGAPGTDDE